MSERSFDSEMAIEETDSLGWSIIESTSSSSGWRSGEVEAEEMDCDREERRAMVRDCLSAMFAGDGDGDGDGGDVDGVGSDG